MLPMAGLEGVSRGLFAEFLVAGEGGGEGEEGAEVVGIAFVSDGESAVTEQPCDRSFDHPTVFAQLLAGLDAFAGDPDGDAAVADPRPQFGVVVGLVGVQFCGVCADEAASELDRWDRSDQRFEGVGVVGVRGGHGH